MSEGFLTRWSRRKREAEHAPSEAAAPASDPGAPSRGVQEVSETRPDDQPEAVPADVESLPPIESITADTDVRAFLAPGIPAQLTRAALRRAWTADPAIRDFVGLAENAWDFNAPESITGFGATVSPQDAQRLLAALTEDQPPPRAPDPTVKSEPTQKPDICAAADDPHEQTALPAPPAAEPPANMIDDREPHDCAVQEETAQEQPTTMARRHGGALPG
jgi:hypothetical protein